MNRSREDRRVLRPAGWFVGLVIACFVAFAVGFLWSWLDSGVGITSAGFFLLSGVGLLAVYQVLTTRVILGEDELVVVRGFSRARYPRGAIRKATWASGCPVSLEVSGHGQVELPELGLNTQGVTNTVRAWLKKRSTASESGRAAERECAADEGTTP